jgi:hypothetical protein
MNHVLIALMSVAVKVIRRTVCLYGKLCQEHVTISYWKSFQDQE